MKEKNNIPKYKNVSTGQPCNAAQYAAEIVCIRKREKENKGSLEFKFWNKSQKEYYEIQIRCAWKIINKYDEKSLLNFLNSDNGRKIYSLGFLHRSKNFVLISKNVEQGVAKCFDDLKEKEQKPQSIIDVPKIIEYKPKESNKKHTLFSKIRNIDDKK